MVDLRMSSGRSSRLPVIGEGRERIPADRCGWRCIQINHDDVCVLRDVAGEGGMIAIVFALKHVFSLLRQLDNDSIMPRRQTLEVPSGASD